MEWLTLGIILLVVVAVLGLGYFLVPYLKKKGIIDKGSAESTDQLMELIGAILKTVDFKNEKLENQVDIVFNITSIAVHYVEQVMTDAPNDEKKQYDVDTVQDVLAKLGVEVNAETLKLIEIGIESAVNALPPTNK
jgi:hypothetical protein